MVLSQTGLPERWKNPVKKKEKKGTLDQNNGARLPGGAVSIKDDHQTGSQRAREILRRKHNTFGDRIGDAAHRRPNV